MAVLWCKLVLEGFKNFTFFDIDFFDIYVKYSIFKNRVKIVNFNDSNRL